MADKHTPPALEEAVTDDTPDSPDTPEEPGSSRGIGIGVDIGTGLGAGIIGGGVVGVLAAVAAAMWIGFQGPAAAPDQTSAPGVTTSLADERPGEPTPQRPATGTDILPPETTGGGTLILQNVGTLDAVVVLARETIYARAVYVRSDERVTIPNVAAGTYEVLMMLGRNWSADGFTQAAAYQELDRPIEFAERDVGAGAEYTRLTVSIEPMTAGLPGMRETPPFQLTAR